ncbi:class I SAM-dependent methyltransferase [Methylogaea oryzae]|uniref:class I SAM-dependent methyltransferase n=1 Tax=Methylogaea oryzae TaxID=1295382 RepID=UPI000A4F26B2|nr:methyltransferase domain-containing protein [Methylogaea oryzae]
MQQQGDYIPAFHFHRLTPWYDRFMAGLYPEARIKGALVAQARLQPGQRLLDMGCGTATLTLLLQQAQPDAEVHGLDADAKILAIARDKALRAEAGIILDLGTAVRLPYPDGSFDRVFASLMLHHLKRNDKQRALREAFRVLKPGGELHVADFGRPHNRRMALIALLVRRFEEIADASTVCCRRSCKKPAFGRWRKRLVTERCPAPCACIGPANRRRPGTLRRNPLRPPGNLPA